MKSSNRGWTGLSTAGAALLLLGACGQGDQSADQPTAEERQKLDNIAAKADEAETFDTSADSLVLNEGVADTGASANEAGPVADTGNTAAQ